MNFTDYLWEKFDKDDRYNSFLAKDSPELFDEWLAEQDVDSLIQWGEEYATKQVEQALTKREALNDL